MTRLFVEAEGETEEAFVDQILSLHLYPLGYTQVTARKMGKDRQRIRRGGVRPWPEARADILNRLRGDSQLLVCVMVDYYGMPQRGEAAWPGRAGAAPQLQYPNAIEESLSRDIANAMGPNFNPRRFIPYIMIHEFEAMLFSDCPALARSLGAPAQTAALQAIRDAFPTPENIDDSPTTAPSKRIQTIIPGYRKPIQGLQATQQIGLPTIRSQCPHLQAWLKHLETLPT